MKKYMIFLLTILLVLVFTACSFNKELPNIVTIKGTEHEKAFVDELYPIDRSFPDSDNEEGMRISGQYYYKYPLTDFDCYIAYDNNANPNVYFESHQFNEALSYYKKADNFNFFCLLGNIHDENEQKIVEIQDVDSLMFDKLLAYSATNDYNPFTSFNNEKDLIKLSIPNPDDWMAEEIHFYKESKDGAFSTQKGYAFILRDDQLYFVYQYDFTNENAPVILVRKLPSDISDYFGAIIEKLSQ